MTEVSMRVPDLLAQVRELTTCENTRKRLDELLERYMNRTLPKSVLKREVVAIAGRDVVRTALHRLVPNVEGIVAEHNLRSVLGGDDASRIRSSIEEATKQGVSDEVLDLARKRIVQLESSAETLSKKSALGIADMEYPSDLCCPITRLPMIDPVVLSDGNTYEKGAVHKLFSTDGPYVSPLTREPLNTSVVIRNRTLLKRIHDYDAEMIRCAEVSCRRTLRKKRRE